MKKGQISEGIVERIDFPAKGIVNTEQGVCVVKNVLPGQKISFRVHKVRKGRAEGILLDVLEASPIQVDSGCPLFGRCGGCTYLSLPYEEQLKIKEEQVERLLQPVLGKQKVPPKTDKIKGSPRPFGYRNKMEFTFGDEEKGGPLSLGLHKKGGFYDILTVSDCRLVDEDYRRILAAVRDYFEDTGLPFYHRLSHQGYLRHLLVRKAAGTGEILVALITTSQLSPELVDFADVLLRLPLDGRIVGILHTYNDSLSDVVQSDRTEILFGQEYFYEELLDLTFKISEFSFFQTNSLGAEVLYTMAREFIGTLRLPKQGGVIYDLYSGTGTIAQLMAPIARKVIGVEIVEEAVAAARENAELNGLHNCEFAAGDVLKMLDTISEPPDLIILDPPRDGVHPKALQKILQYGVENILYISCKPTSLARDLEAFLGAGYEAVRVGMVDQFPWTANVETVVLLSKLKSAKSIEVKIELGEMDLTTAESKATYEEIKQYVFDNTGLKVSQLYVAQVKRKHGLIERINYNVGNGKSKVPQVPAEKEKAIEDALRYFKMI